MALPDPKELARLTIDYLGGPHLANEVFSTEFGEMNRRWNQDTETIGRILRAHLYVEHYLNEYLRKANPRLGDIAGVRLSFAQKVKLLDQNDPHIRHMIAGIKHLNSIRNRIAHNLDVQVSEEDAEVFLKALPLREMRKQMEGANKTHPEPLQLLEDFSTHAAHALSQQFSKFGAAFTRALNELSDESPRNRQPPGILEP